MMKIEKSTEKINPFGGINFVFRTLLLSGLIELVDKQLGSRPPQAEYAYSDIILDLWTVFLCGGDCAEDLNDHIKPYLSDVPGLKVANSDTVLRTLKKLKTPKETVASTSGQTYEINKNDTLNQLNISILKHTKLLTPGEYYNFDYDNEVLKTEKYDTKRTYKQVNGYFPGMATISGMPVYFENRDGNMNVKTNQEEVLERAYKMLKDNEIRIDKSRMDAGSYSKKIVDVVEKYSKTFYIRANRCDMLTDLLLVHRDWEKVEINHQKYEACSIEYAPFKSGKKGEGKDEKSYRLVVMRRKKKNDQQLDLFTKDNMEYRSILTNDRLLTEKEVIEYYNQRGTEEKTIDILNNDFGWSNMPFSFMEENTVFLIIMMICKNIYTWIIRKFSETYKMLKNSFRIKKFIFRFVTVPAKWIKKGRQMVLKVYSNRPYEKLIL